ncbi:hypothetical protein [Methanoculleus sp. 10]|jgi:hypothetical protein|uniref:hypothetical protein n=1 Tax=Methanoculleus sp. 10 TaxID=430615 RepID=UPI001B696533|nr:hypothetical protein [Methanoculleus sp. 10]MBP7410434.1 hypothetical protein [Methanoculleus sp.]
MRGLRRDAGAIARWTIPLEREGAATVVRDEGDKPHDPGRIDYGIRGSPGPAYQALLDRIRSRPWSFRAGRMCGKRDNAGEPYYCQLRCHDPPGDDHSCHLSPVRPSGSRPTGPTPSPLCGEGSPSPSFAPEQVPL